MTRINEIDFETISKEEALRVYNEWGGKDSKWKDFLDGFIASRKVAIELKAGFNKNNPHAILGKQRRKEYPNIKVISRTGKVFVMNLALMPEIQKR